MSSSLKLRGILGLGLLAALVAALAIVVPLALAVPQDLDDHFDLIGGGPGGSEWEVDEHSTCNIDEDGNVVEEGELDVADQTVIGLQDDAFDDALLLVVDDVPFLDSDSFGDLTIDASGQSLAMGPEAMSDLSVSMEYKALSSEAKLRTFVTFENPTGADIVVPVRQESDLGSDSDTAVRGSSSGDAAFTTADRWVVTSDDATTPEDPVITFVLFGPGSPEATPTSATVGVPDDDCIVVGYEVTVPAGETRHLLFFNQMSQTNEDALADAPTQFDSNPPIDGDLLSGLTEDQLLLVLNWDFAPPPTPTPTPPPPPTPAPTPTPTSTPVVLAATTTPTPAALPESGGVPSQGGSSTIPGLLAIAGALAIMSAGGLWLAHQRRRVR